MTASGVIVIVAAVLLAIWDAYAVWKWGADASISRFIQSTSLRSPLFTFCIGIIVGHIFAFLPPDGKP